MSEIKVSDLVMITRPIACCGNQTAVGKVLTVIRNGSNGCYCPHCLTIFASHEDKFFLLSNGKVYHGSRLKKIDPPALDEEAERVLELEIV